ncbi:MAG: activator of photopigment and puc expression [Sulfitobacter sp.]|nr:activator of photopigment and puc expression [Roseobacter sp.]MBV49501.1 activator of photopigment and puc expression [Roseobacter sp.]PHR07730.1 MAG: activator of photopigment and puc expression [Sulfitobacter sp.]
MSMIRLLYFSTAAYSVTKETVAEIVEQATAANSVHNITGALAYNGRNFCQLLEGEETAVRRLVANIIADDRHSGFKILDEKPITTRHFDSWSMQLVDRLDFSVVINAMEA